MRIVKAVVVGLAVCLAGSVAYGQATKGKMAKAPKAKAELSTGDTAKMTCAAARSTVVSKNAVVLHTGANRFDRYVTSARYCGTGEQVSPAMVKAKDTPLCFVGYTCEEPSEGGGEGGGDSE